MSDDKLTGLFSLNKYKFDQKVISQIKDNILIKEHWPIVYILVNKKRNEAYVGESANAVLRMINHLYNPERKKLGELYLILSTDFNKSATLNIESCLIEYISGDGHIKLQNGNLGLRFHNYYQKKNYAQLFVEIWEKLKKEGIAIKGLREINNEDLFKYSPYKSLSDDQYNSLLEIIRALIEKEKEPIFVKGAAGTGKTILAIFLIKLLTTNFFDLFEDNNDEKVDMAKGIIYSLKQKFPHPSVALVVPMTSLRNTLKTVFAGIKGLKANMVIGPSDVFKRKYDILIVDEAHRLRRRKNITNYNSFDQNNSILGLDKSGTELDWILMQSSKQIFFYDSAQSIKPSDITKNVFDKLLKKSTELELQSQLRVKGGIDYITYIDDLLNVRLPLKIPVFKDKEYDFFYFDSLQLLMERLKEKENETGLCRLISGYSWKWKSKKDKDRHDMEIDGIDLRWNSNFRNWINSKNAFNEVGCIHTTQGYDLNYAGVIFGEEISYDENTNRIIILEENYHDVKGKTGIVDPQELKRYIINIYKTNMYRGVHGTYIYACDNNLKKYLAKHIPKYIDSK